jgi:hypothetical protein
MPGIGLREFDDWLTRRFVRFGAIGLLCSIAAIVIGQGGRYLLPVSPSTPGGILLLRLVAAAVHGWGLGAFVLFAMMVVAGLFGMAVPDWNIRRVVGLTLVIAAAGAFLFVPICWSPTSDDCRSLAVRATDAVFRRAS